MSEESKIVFQVSEFDGKNIPVTEAAKIIGKDQQFIRQGMIAGILPIGTVFKKEGSNQYDYYISPKMFWSIRGMFIKVNLR